MLGEGERAQAEGGCPRTFLRFEETGISTGVWPEFCTEPSGRQVGEESWFLREEPYPRTEHIVRKCGKGPALCSTWVVKRIRK